MFNLSKRRFWDFSSKPRGEATIRATALLDYVNIQSRKGWDGMVWVIVVIFPIAMLNDRCCHSGISPR
jgi:hypothetical protein